MDKDVLRDLARSGLGQADAKRMKVQLLTPGEVQRLTGTYYASAYKLPYFEANGKVNGFYRLRFLEPVIDLKKGKELRYWQPPKTTPHLYLPPVINWDDVLKNKDIAVTITEGEKKAYAGAKLLKRAVLGLGGVWSWRSKPLRETVIDGLLDFLKDRKVVICFDVDPAPNPDVAAARHFLARAVRQYGGTALNLPLPVPEEGRKSGLDDVLVDKGVDYVKSIEPEALIDDTALQQLNAELAIVEDKGCIYHLVSRTLHTLPKQLVQVVYADKIIQTFDAKGNPTEKNAVSEWLKWPQRRKHAALEYRPGEPDILPNNILNMWVGWGVPPKKGDVSLFVKLVDHTFAHAPKEHKKWFLQWLAYPIQYPGTKLYSTVVLFSQLQGVGKSLLGLTMGRVYGDENFVHLDAEMLHDKFNEWRLGKQFILGDEVTGRDRREDIERLKLLIVMEKATINVKFQPLLKIRDCANYLLATNHIDALSLPKHDRRFFVHEIVEKTLSESWFTSTYDPWYKSTEGAGALHYYLRQVDLTGFNPRGEPPVTATKQEMQELSGGDIDYRVREFLRNQETVTSLVPRDLYMASELSLLLDPEGKLSHLSLAKALRRAGLQAYATAVDKGTVKLYAVRNSAHWRKATHSERSAHYDGKKPDSKKERKK